MQVIDTNVTQTWLETNSYSDEWCSTPPSSMYVFTTMNSYAENFTYTAMVPIFFYEYWPYAADTSINGTLGVTSGMDILLPTSAPDEAIIRGYAPTASNGASYCYLTALDSSSLFTYQNILYLNDGFCVDPYYSPARCFPNGTLAFYPGTSGCEGTPETFDLSSLSQELTSDYAGSFLAKTITIGTASTPVGWVNFVPGMYLIPNFKHPAEIFEVIFFILALLGYLYSCFFSAMKFKKSPKLEPFTMFFSQLLWVTWIILRIYYIYKIFDNDFVMSQVSSALGWLGNFATLSSVIYTSMIYFKIQASPISVKVAILLFLFASHMMFAGANYARIWMAMDSGNYTPSDSFLDWYDKWDLLSPYWIIIMFVWDIVPLSVVVFKVVNVESGVLFISVVQKIWEIDNRFILAIATQLCIVFLYYLCSILDNYTTIPYSDRVALAISAYQAFFLAAHSLLNCYMVVRLKVVMNRIKKTGFGTTTSQASSSQLQSAIKSTRSLVSKKNLPQ
ncbi:hypothetical protein HDV03_002860 [Kappamyces sp. JEL0829]|nr:hypothetical protein HDV03_002860 [Kappamyces sp. JEL0829]